MEDLNRTFKKSTILNLLEGDLINGNPDGNLNLDSPDYKIVGIRLAVDYEEEAPFNIIPESKRVEIKLLFVAEQKSLVRPYSRVLKFYYADLPQGPKNKVKDFYNWVTDSLIKVLPELADGEEQP